MRIDAATPRHTGGNKMSVLSSGRPSSSEWTMPIALLIEPCPISENLQGITPRFGQAAMQ